MATIQQVIYDPNRGLVPYLDRVLGQQWGRFQIRRAGQTTGIRLGQFSFETYGEDTECRVVNRTLTLGYTISLNNVTPFESYLEVGNFSDTLTTHVLQWAKSTGRSLLAGPVTAGNGFVTVAQNPKVSGGKEQAYSGLVSLEIEVSHLQP